MKCHGQIFISIGLALCIYGGLAWPIPRWIHRGIPAAAHLEPANVQPPFPCDALQLLYHFQLAADMLDGRTPWFHNLYEFNTGNDRQRFMPGSYYFPFSLFYAAGNWLGGPAIGWNLAALLSIWLTVIFTWQLAIRFAHKTWLAWLAVLASLWLPYRWINLFGGSPAGFAMAWPPAVWLGIDLAVRGRRHAGGWLAGGALLLSALCDSHVFFFCALAAPLWGLIAMAADETFPWRRWQDWLRSALALLPVALGAAIGLAFPIFMEQLYRMIVGTAPEAARIGQRTLGEVKLYSPPLRGIFDWSARGLAEQIFIGFAAPLTLAIGGLAALRQCLRGFIKHENKPHSGRILAVLGLVVLGMIAVCILAAGARGPGDGAILEIMRRIVPPYRMIRQPAKIFTIMPVLLAVGWAVAARVLTDALPKRLAAFLLAVIIGIGVWENGRRVKPTICLLEPRQGAYAAVVQDAAARGVPARALVVPLWPGDAHYTSLYQFYAAQYRVRMVNGYRPFVRQHYYTNVFERLVSVNQGWLNDAQIKHLAEMGVAYLILHEDLFPEKVSPFPVGVTLQNFLNHPALEWLAQDESVWAFRIRHDKTGSTSAAPDAVEQEFFGSARRWECENCRCKAAEKISRADAGNGTALRLQQEHARFTVPPQRIWPAPRLRWLLRARGCGLLAPTLCVDTQMLPAEEIFVAADHWQWYEVSAEVAADYAPLALELAWQGGVVDCDMVVLAAGDWPLDFKLGKHLTLPASAFFHAGYTDRAAGTVNLRRARDPQHLIFYGPKLPLPAGRYKLALAYDSAEKPAAPLAQINIRQSPADPIRWHPVFAGYPAEFEFDLPQNLPFHLELLFLGQADMRLHAATFTRLN